MTLPLRLLRRDDLYPDTSPAASGGTYSNLYKTKQAGSSKNLQSFTPLLDQAIASRGVPAEWKPYLTELIGRESSWNPNAKNPTSTARGYGQFLDGTVKDYEKKYGIKYDGNPMGQIALTIQYVKDRYGTPQKALEFWDKNKWY